MALTVTVTRGYNFVAGTQVSVDDFNAAALPSVTLTGAVGSSDLANGAVGADQISDQILNGFATVTTLAVDDKFAIYDASGQVNASITAANTINGVFGLAPVATFFTDFAVDTVTSHDGTSAQRMTVAYFAESLIGQAPALAALADADEILVRDASAAAGSQASRITGANLLPSVGTPGTYVGITSLTTDAKGRVTAVTQGAGLVLVRAFETTGTLPTGDGYANGTTVTLTPSFGGRPSTVDLYLECMTVDQDWAVGDLIPATKLINQTNSHQVFTPVWTTADTLKVVRINSTPLLYRKDGASAAAFTQTSWQFRLIATKYG